MRKSPYCKNRIHKFRTLFLKHFMQKGTINTAPNRYLINAASAAGILDPTCRTMPVTATNISPVITIHIMPATIFSFSSALSITVAFPLVEGRRKPKIQNIIFSQSNLEYLVWEKLFQPNVCSPCMSFHTLSSRNSRSSYSLLFHCILR